MELKIKNFGHVDGAEVRIIKVSDGSVFENLNDQFQPMDELGMEYGIKIPAGLIVSCTGASSIVGTVTLGPEDGPHRVSVYLNDRLLGVADENNWLDDLVENSLVGDMEIQVRFLSEWTPAPQR